MKWTFIGTRRVAVQVAEAWCYGWGQAMKKVYGVYINSTLIYRDEKKTDIFADAKDYKRFYSGLLTLLQDERFVKDFHPQAQKRLEELYSEMKKILAVDLKKLTDKQLLKLFEKEILPRQTQFYVRMWTVYQIGEPMTETMSNILRKKLNDGARVTELLVKLAEPLSFNDAISNRYELLKLAVDANKLKPAELDMKLKLHAKKFQHIPVYDIDHDPYTYDHFKQELKEIKDAAKELKKLESEIDRRKKEHKKIISELKPDRKFLALINFIKENSFLRDYRDSIRQKLNLELKKYYEELADRMKITLEEVITLVNSEIIEYFGQNKRFPQEELNRRKKSFFLIVRGEKIKILSGNEALKKAELELGLNKASSNQLLRGVIGSKGKAKGVVKIVYTNRDLDKVKEGEILVSSMTRQDFVPAMRRAGAIVTDEGGVTCHAAIVARELETPCVIGTKIATKVLKDGDQVEVDANKGIVKKI